METQINQAESPPQTPQLDLSDPDTVNIILDGMYETEQERPGFAEQRLNAIRQQCGVDLTAAWMEYQRRQEKETAIKSRGKPLDISQGLDPPDVKTLLDYNTVYDRNGNVKDQKVIQSVKNWQTVLTYDKRFSGKICYDEFNMRINLKGNTPWATDNNVRGWTDTDDAQAFSLIQSDYGLQRKAEYMDATAIVASQNSYHPVRQMLDSIVWDKAERVEMMLVWYLGAPDTPYTRAVTKLWYLEGTGRIYQPGVKADYCLIIDGAQGLGKSSFARLAALDDSFFNDSLDSLDGATAAQQLIGSWVIELAELKSLGRTTGGMESVKRFISAQTDKFRAPYERRATIIQRQCVFIGTTNKSDFLTDPTGNRRFLIIHAGVNEPTKDLFAPEAVEDFRQAWAEAVTIWKEQKPKLVLPKEFAQEALQYQEQSMSDDGKPGLIRAYLEDKDRVCALQIWQDCLHETGRPARWESSEINDIVAATPGWIKATSTLKFEKYGIQKGFYKQKSVNQKSVSLQNNADGFMKISPGEENELPFD